MSDTDTDLNRLQDVLNAIPAERDGMTIAQLDGYVAAPIVCPEMILPSEWLPGVWGGEHEFADVDEAEATIAVVIEHYNRIARELAEYPEDYEPVLEIDPNGGETLWEPWIDGFERAMRLCPDAWEEIALSDDEEAQPVHAIRNAGLLCRHDAAHRRLATAGRWRAIPVSTSTRANQGGTHAHLQLQEEDGATGRGRG